MRKGKNTHKTKRFPYRFDEYLKNIEISNKVLHMLEMGVMLLAATHKVEAVAGTVNVQGLWCSSEMFLAQPESLLAILLAPS